MRSRALAQEMQTALQAATEEHQRAEQRLMDDDDNEQHMAHCCEEMEFKEILIKVWHRQHLTRRRSPPRCRWLVDHHG